MERGLNLTSGIFTLVSTRVTELAEDLKWAKVSYKILANGNAGEVLLTDHTRLKPSRTKGVLHGYVVRNDKRKFEIFYNLDTQETTYKVL